MGSLGAMIDDGKVHEVRSDLARALRTNLRSGDRRSATKVHDVAARARRVIAGNKRFTPPARGRSR